MDEQDKPVCHVCERPCTEPLQLTMDGEATCLPCISAVTALVRGATKPEARDDGR